MTGIPGYYQGEDSTMKTVRYVMYQTTTGFCADAYWKLGDNAWSYIQSHEAPTWDQLITIGHRIYTDGADCLEFCEADKLVHAHSGSEQTPQGKYPNGLPFNFVDEIVKAQYKALGILP